MKDKLRDLSVIVLDNNKKINDTIQEDAATIIKAKTDIKARAVKSIVTAEADTRTKAEVERFSSEVERAKAEVERVRSEVERAEANIKIYKAKSKRVKAKSKRAKAEELKENLKKLRNNELKLLIDKIYNNLHDAAIDIAKEQITPNNIIIKAVLKLSSDSKTDLSKGKEYILDKLNDIIKKIYIKESFTIEGKQTDDNYYYL